MEKKLLRKGKVKEVYDLGDALEFNFTDQVSVFDKVVPSLIPRKGESLCRTAEYWFKKADSTGINSHFIKAIPPNGMIVKKVDVISDYSQLTRERCNYLIPLEVICRYYVAGSMHDRLNRGDVLPEALGFPAGKVVGYGAQIPEPFIEFTTKLEKVDRPISEDEALSMAALSEEELSEIKESVLKIDDSINRQAKEKGLLHVDGKKEFAFDEERRLMVIDTYGTADEDRFWDREKYEEGKFVELSKEFVRQYYRDKGYHQELEKARREGAPEPPLPPLPEDIVRQVSELYGTLFERITGQKF